LSRVRTFTSLAGPVDLVLLRGMLPDLTLRPGAVMSGRVLDPTTLVLEGVRLKAELPAGVEAGQRLRLRVEEADPAHPERLHLRVLEPAARPQETSAPLAPSVPDTAYQLALPGGAIAHVVVDEREAARGRRAKGDVRSVVVRYDSPTLGRLDVRLDADGAAVHVSAGEPALTVRGAADVLRDALARATGRPVLVTVHPRQETLDVRV
jgi:hypothetical protein